MRECTESKEFSKALKILTLVLCRHSQLIRVINVANLQGKKKKGNFTRPPLLKTEEWTMLITLPSCEDRLKPPWFYFIWFYFTTLWGLVPDSVVLLFAIQHYFFFKFQFSVPIFMFKCNKDTGFYFSFKFPNLRVWIFLNRLCEFWSFCIHLMNQNLLSWMGIQPLRSSLKLLICSSMLCALLFCLVRWLLWGNRYSWVDLWCWNAAMLSPFREACISVLFLCCLNESIFNTIISPICTFTLGCRMNRMSCFSCGKKDLNY